MNRRGVLSGASALLIGATITLAGATAGGLLLVEGTGLLRGAVTIMALQAGALAAGAWSAEGIPSAEVAGALRLWWTGALASLALAAVVAAWWQFRGLPGIPFNRGLALGILVGLPQLMLGATVVLLGRDRRVASPVLAGAAGGLLLGGLVLLPRTSPSAVFVGAMVLVGLSGILHAAEPPPGHDDAEGADS
jgi:hypothetical protein